MSIGLYIVLAPLYLKSVRKLQEKRFVFVKILAIIIPENGAKVSKIKCFQFAQQTLITFTDSRSMFENLWQEWFDTKLFLMAKNTPMEGKGSSEIFQCLPEQDRRALTDRKAYFAKMAEIE